MVDTLEEYLRAIDEYETRIGKRLVGRSVK